MGPTMKLTFINVISDNLYSLFIYIPSKVLLQLQLVTEVGTGVHPTYLRTPTSYYYNLYVQLFSYSYIFLHFSSSLLLICQHHCNTLNHPSFQFVIIFMTRKWYVKQMRFTTKFICVNWTFVQ